MFQKYYFPLVFLIVRLAYYDAVEASRKWGSKKDGSLQGIGVDVDEDSKRPNLLVSKILSTEVFAVGWDIVVKYEIRNVGTGHAYNIILEDLDLTNINSRFDVRDGSPVMKVKSLAGGGAAEYFNVTVVPNDLMKVGLYAFSPAKVMYEVDPYGMSEVITGYSSISPAKNNGTFYFITHKEAIRKYKPKTMEYCIFFLMCMVPIGIPFGLWMQNKRKYEKLQEISRVLRAGRKMKSK